MRILRLRLSRDHDDRRSTGGFVFLLSNAAISWKAKKQQSVALSSLGVEYMASSKAVKEAIWIRRLYNDIIGKSTETPIIIHMDNLGCIQSIENPRFHERTKHMFQPIRPGGPLAQIR